MRKIVCVAVCVVVCVLVAGPFTAALGEDATDVGVIPRPAKTTITPGSFAITPRTAILVDAVSRPVGELLAEQLAPAAGAALKVSDWTGGDPPAGSVLLRTDAALKDACGDEGYRLAVSKDAVRADAPTAAGLFYACQTLRQLLPPSAVAKAPAAAGPPAEPAVSLVVPCVRIEDRPRFAWRGLMLDCSRTFQSPVYIRRTIDVMGLYKLNVLHLHLTDDQGWRLEIRKYPRLTDLGSKFPDRFKEPPANQGFYTRQEMRELIAYAAARHVTIVPEIEMPGHSLAVLACYPELSCTGGPFEIFPFFKGPGVMEDVLCAGNDRTFAFLQDVLAEVIELFPSRYIHVGGDEVPKTRWNNCPKCQARLKAQGLKNAHELQSYFIKRVEKFINSNGRRLIGWDEILEGGLAPNAAVMSWRGVNGGIAAARSGHDVVMSPTSHCYFDYNYQTTPLAKVYAFEPIPPALSPREARFVLGAQANFWSHIDRTPERADQQIYPRLLALAERVWSPKDSGPYADFCVRLRPQLERLTRMGVAYTAVDKTNR